LRDLGKTTKTWPRSSVRSEIARQLGDRSLETRARPSDLECTLVAESRGARGFHRGQAGGRERWRSAYRGMLAASVGSALAALGRLDEASVIR
jgi:hypothetical protein